MPKSDSEFRDRVYDIIAQVPKGRVVTYGDVALWAGHPTAARIVGQIAHFGPPDLPWHRLVNRFGGLASGYYNGRDGQKRMLEQEGLQVGDSYSIVNLEPLRWRPEL